MASGGAAVSRRMRVRGAQAWAMAWPAAVGEVVVVDESPYQPTEQSGVGTPMRVGPGRRLSKHSTLRLHRPRGTAMLTMPIAWAKRCYQTQRSRW